MEALDLRGLVPAPVTPFTRDGEVDHAAIQRLGSWLGSFKGVKGLVVLGHAGEGTFLTADEQTAVIESFVKSVDGKIPVIAGITLEGTKVAALEAKRAVKAGAEAGLVYPSHGWLRFGYQKGAPQDRYRAIYQESGLPLILFQYPDATKATYNLETQLEIAALPGVFAMKNGVRNMRRWDTEIPVVRRERPNLQILTCHDEYLLHTMFDVDGALVGYGGLTPEPLIELIAAGKAKDYPKARAIHDRLLPVTRTVYHRGSHMEGTVALKHGLVARGILEHATVRPPLLPLDPGADVEIANALRSAGLLPDAGIARIPRGVAPTQSQMRRSGFRSAAITKQGGEFMSARIARRQFILSSLAMASASVVATRPRADANARRCRPIRIVVPFAAGGGVDVFARLISEKLRQKHGVTIVVDNRAGANGSIGGNAVKNAKPDGTTLLFSAGTHVMARQVMKSAPYDPLADFAAIARVGEAPMMLIASPKIAPNNVGELIAEARKAPDKWTFATVGARRAGPSGGARIQPPLGAELADSTLSRHRAGIERCRRRPCPADDRPGSRAAAAGQFQARQRSRGHLGKADAARAGLSDGVRKRAGRHGPFVVVRRLGSEEIVRRSGRCS